MLHYAKTYCSVCWIHLITYLQWTVTDSCNKRCKIRKFESLQCMKVFFSFHFQWVCCYCIKVPLSSQLNRLIDLFWTGTFWAGIALVVVVKAQVLLITLMMALLYSSVLVSHDSEPACTIPGPWNFLILFFTPVLCLPPKCQNVFCEKGLLPRSTQERPSYFHTNVTHQEKLKACTP